jgi:GR25 family glycosyltransferase involved in LPS biosynthesis
MNKDDLQTKRADFISINLIGRKLTNGEIACAMGHEGIYELINNSKDDISLIFEDDARIIDNMESVLESFKLIKEPAILQLYNINLNNKKIENHEADDYLSFEKLVNPTPRTHAYAINKLAVDVIVQEIGKTKKIFSTADWPHLWFHKVHFYQVKKSLVIWEELESSIEHERREITRSLLDTAYKFLVRSHLAGLSHRIALTSLLFKLHGFPIVSSYFHLVVARRVNPNNNLQN